MVLRDILHSFTLSEIVTKTTCMGNDGSSSRIDLVFMSVPENLSECETVPPLANSDHLGIYIKLKNQPTHRKRRTIC